MPISFPNEDAANIPLRVIQHDLLESNHIRIARPKQPGNSLEITVAPNVPGEKLDSHRPLPPLNYFLQRTLFLQIRQDKQKDRA